MKITKGTKRSVYKERTKMTKETDELFTAAYAAYAAAYAIAYAAANTATHTAAYAAATARAAAIDAYTAVLKTPKEN